MNLAIFEKRMGIVMKPPPPPEEPAIETKEPPPPPPEEPPPQEYEDKPVEEYIREVSKREHSGCSTEPPTGKVLRDRIDKFRSYSPMIFVFFGNDCLLVNWNNIVIRTFNLKAFNKKSQVFFNRKGSDGKIKTFTSGDEKCNRILTNKVRITAMLDLESSVLPVIDLPFFEKYEAAVNHILSTFTFNVLFPTTIPKYSFQNHFLNFRKTAEKLGKKPQNPNVGLDMLYIFKVPLGDDKKDVFKIGRTLNIQRRKGEYPKGTLQCHSSVCSDCIEMETEMLKAFKKRFRHQTEDGKEYFRGDFVEMRNLFNKVLQDDIPCLVVKNLVESD
jgi:hypothetical protein